MTQLQQPPLPACPNSQAMAHAETLIAKYKHEYITTNIPAMQSVDVPIDQRAEYNRILEQLFSQCQDTEQKLGMIYVLFKQDDLFQKLITIICTVQQQRSLLSIANNPRFIINLDAIRNMASELQRATDMFTSMFQVMMASHQPLYQSGF